MGVEFLISELFMSIKINCVIEIRFQNFSSLIGGRIKITDALPHL